MSIPIICPKNYWNCGVKIEYDPKRIFVLMPFREEQAPQKLFTDVLAVLPGWSVHRADTDFAKPEIWCKICSNIQSSRAVIADLSGPNANVFLELGLAWGLGRPFVLLAQDTKSLPFDTKTFHVIQYERLGDFVKAPSELASQIIRSLDSLPELPLSLQAQARSPEAHLHQRVADAKARTAQMWRRSGGNWFLTGVSRGEHGVAISLLKDYPTAKRVIDIAREIGVTEGRVSQILKGTYADTGRYFGKIKDAWTLSDEGLYWVLDDVITAALSRP